VQFVFEAVTASIVSSNVKSMGLYWDFFFDMYLRNLL
jgi:hypothetical protein